MKELVDVVAKLRGPDGCPWDKEQTHLSLTQYILEESYELIEAIERQDDEEFLEELGDFLFQVVLQAQIAEERGAFTFKDVVERVTKKMIDRHPHVFKNNDDSITTEEVLNQWEEIKKKEKNKKRKTSFNLPLNLPALQGAHKIGCKTERWNFDWKNAGEVLRQVKLEINELEEALSGSDQERRHELGDVLFSLAQLGRHLGTEPEQALRSANRRFEQRFFKMVEAVGNLEVFQQMTMDEKEQLWQKAKQQNQKEEKLGEFTDNL